MKHYGQSLVLKYCFLFCFSVGEEKISKAIRNQNKYSKDKDKKNLKRPHSPSDDEEIKNVDASGETAL